MLSPQGSLVGAGVGCLHPPEAGCWVRDAAAPLKSLQGFFHCLLPRVPVSPKPSLDNGLAEGGFYRYRELLQLEDKAGFSYTAGSMDMILSKLWEFVLDRKLGVLQSMK